MKRWAGSPGLTLAVCSLPILFSSLILLMAPYWHWQQAHLHRLYLHSFPMLGCLVSRNNGQQWELTAVQRTHMGMQLQNIHLFIVFHLFFSLFHSEIHERSNPLCEERLARVRDRVGDASPRIPALGLCLCWADVAALALHPQGQEDNSPQDVLRDTQHDSVRPREQVNGGFPGAGIALSLSMVVDIFLAGLGEQAWGSGLTQNPAREVSTALGRVAGGVWATWALAQLLGCARETSLQ